MKIGSPVIHSTSQLDIRGLDLKKATLLSLLVLPFIESCDTSVDLSAPFEPRLVVYSVLSTQSDTQYVRVSTTYNSLANGTSGSGEGETVVDAQVTVLQQDGSMIAFQPAVIEFLDSSGSISSIEAYRAYPFRPEEGKKYVLTVSSPTSGTATGTITIPGQGSIKLTNSIEISDPFNNEIDFGFQAALSPEAMGYLGQIYVDYSRRLPDGTYRPERFQIPLRRDTVSVALGVFRLSYPQLTRRSTAANSTRTIGEIIQYTEAVAYGWGVYRAVLRNLFDTQGDDLKFSHAVVYLIQFDEPLWRYWGASNNFHDKLSIRLDDPDYTNITRGVGMFGSLTVDSLIMPLPEKLPLPAH